MKNIETRLLRLERILKPAQSGPVEIAIIGVARGDDGTLEEDDVPSIIFHILGNWERVKEDVRK